MYRDLLFVALTRLFPEIPHEQTLPSQPTTTLRLHGILGVIGLVFVLGWLVRDIRNLSARTQQPTLALTSRVVEHVPLVRRQQIFRDLTTPFASYRKNAENRFADAWSGSDDFHHHERIHVGAMASRYQLSKTEIYLILDEGIRTRWLAAHGRPLTARVPPLKPRVQ